MPVKVQRENIVSWQSRKKSERIVSAACGEAEPKAD